eukprot:1813897-Amphidinium_carterae.1
MRCRNRANECLQTLHTVHEVGEVCWSVVLKRCHYAAEVTPYSVLTLEELVVFVDNVAFANSYVRERCN